MIEIFGGVVLFLWLSQIFPPPSTYHPPPSTMSFEAMLERAKNADGFLAALDQSGGAWENCEWVLHIVPDGAARCA
jgi:hypothetical protein